MASKTTLSLAAILALLLVVVVQVKADDDDDDDDDDDTLQRRLITEQDDDDEEYGDMARVLARASDRIELETPDLPTAVLLKMVKKALRSVDEDEDGYLSAEEIQDWMEQAVERIRTHDTAATFDERDEDDDGKVTWQEFLASDPDVGDTKDAEAILPKDPKLRKLKQRELKEDRELFDAADADDDGFLTEEEHRAFREPDRYPHTLEVLYTHTMARKDADGDGVLSRAEFVANVDVDEDARPSEFDEEERDDDGDDVMSREEILQWLRHDYTSEIKATVAAVMTADDDRDGRVTVAELREEPQLLREYPLLMEAAARLHAFSKGAPRARVEL